MKGLFEAAHSVVERNTEGLELLLVPACSDSKHQSLPAHFVNGGGNLR
jgi:hypothetical protein